LYSIKERKQLQANDIWLRTTDYRLPTRKNWQTSCINIPGDKFGTLKNDPMPLFYHGFFPAAFIMLILSLGIKVVYQYWKENQQKL
jgi:hypothetical protein